MAHSINGASRLNEKRVPELIGTNEAAKMLGYTINSFRMFVRLNRPFNVYKMSSNKMMYDKNELIEYIESKRVQPIEILPV